MARRRLEYLPVADLPSAVSNAKKHDEQLIARSVSRFGYIEPIVLDERTGTIVSGHGRRDELLRAEAAGEQPPDGIVVKAGRWLAPVQRGWSSKDDAEALAAGIALNQSTIAGGWDLELLAPALQELAALDALDLDAVGFAPSDIDSILATLELARTPEEEKPPPVMPGVPADPITRPGDLWQRGEHRLICGDCRDLATVERLLDGAQVNVAFTSPPYAEQRDYDAESGFAPIPPDGYVAWFALVAANVAEVLAPDGSWFVNIKPPARDLDTHLYVLDLVIAHVREWDWHFATEFCWERTGVPKQVVLRFKNQFEPIYQFTRGRWKVRPDNVRHATESAITPMGVGAGDTSWRTRQGDHGVIQQNEPGMRPRRKPQSGSNAESQGGDWDAGGMIGVGFAYPGNRLPTFSGSYEATGHAAAFPVGLPGWFVRAYSDPGDVIFDPFVGHGATILAAEQEDRRGFGVELSPGYCDVAVARWEAHTGQKATRL